MSFDGFERVPKKFFVSVNVGHFTRLGGSVSSRVAGYRLLKGPKGVYGIFGCA